MATKHFCDGCDKEHSMNDLTEITVEWRRNSVGIEERKFDLCRFCLEQFKDKFPNKWPRAIPETSSIITPAPHKHPAIPTLDDEDIPF